MERIQMVWPRLAVALTVLSVSFAGRSAMSQKNGTNEFSGVARRDLASIRAAAQYSDFREQVWFPSNSIGPRLNARHRQRRLSTTSPNKCATSSPRSARPGYRQALGAEKRGGLTRLAEVDRWHGSALKANSIEV